MILLSYGVEVVSGLAGVDCYEDMAFFSITKYY